MEQYKSNKSEKDSEIAILFDRVKHLDSLAFTIRTTAVALWAATIGLKAYQLSKHEGSPPPINFAPITLFEGALTIAIVFWIMEARIRAFYEGVNDRLRDIISGNQLKPYAWHLSSEEGSFSLVDVFRWIFHWEQSLFHGALICVAVMLFWDKLELASASGERAAVKVATLVGVFIALLVWLALSLSNQRRTLRCLKHK